MRARLLLGLAVVALGLTGAGAAADPGAIPPPPPPPSPPQPPPGPPPPPVVQRCVVPNLKGMTVVQARGLLRAGNCRLGRVSRAYSRKVRKGRIVSQNRRFGARVTRGAKVSVVVSRGRRR